MASPSVAEIEQFRQGLIERKNFILNSKENQSSQEKMEVVLREKWIPIQKKKEEKFFEKAAQTEQIVRLEVAILESVKKFVSAELVSDLGRALVKIRATNDLQGLRYVYSRYKGEKDYQAIKLISAVYRYNRDFISGYTPSPALKSSIGNATKCPHCGEDAKYILMNMMESQSVLLPS